MDLFEDSGDDDPFFGFTAEDIVLHEVKCESDINVSDVSSVHMADLLDWDDNLSDFDDSDKSTPVNAPRDNQGWTTHISYFFYQNLGV